MYAHKPAVILIVSLGVVALVGVVLLGAFYPLAVAKQQAGASAPHGVALRRRRGFLRRSRGGQPPADGIADEGGRLMNVELAHQVDPMRLDGFDTQPQVRRNLLGRLPLRNALDDLTLARG